MRDYLISIRPATMDDAEFLFNLRNEPSIRESSFSTGEISLESHRQWLAQKLKDPNSFIYLVSADEDMVGQVRIDIKDRSGTISVAISYSHRGRGFGRTAIQKTCSLIFSENPNVEEINAYIKLSNTASLKAFMKSGFSQEDIIKIGGHDCHKTVLRKKGFILQQLEKAEFVPPIPGVLRIEPASACNLKCRHCPTGLDMNPNVGIMDMNTFGVIFDKIKHLRFRVIVMYHGGEPLLNRNLIEMAKTLRPIAGRIEFNSNATILTDRIIEEIVRANVIDRISFSIDGNSPEENDKIRVGANFHKLVANIKKLIVLRNSLGFERPKIFIANTQIPETQTVTDKIEVPRFLSDAFEDIASDVHFKCTYALIWAGMAIQPGVLRPNNNFCDHVINTLTIRANGDIVPCCYDLTTEMKLGNILEQSLEEIWESKKFAGLRRSIARFSPPKLCRGCEVLYPQAVMTRKDIKTT